jgi:hypothetical protein
VWAAPELLGAPTIGGEKTGGFAQVLAYKSPKTPFFAQKYLTRYTHKTFF